MSTSHNWGERFDVISSSENTSVMADNRVFRTCSTLMWPVAAYIELQRQKSHTETTYGVIFERERLRTEADATQLQSAYERLSSRLNGETQQTYLREY